MINCSHVFVKELKSVREHANMRTVSLKAVWFFWRIF